MVQCQNAKNSLNEAKELLVENKKEDAMDKIALAFEQVIGDYENRKRNPWGQSPFFFGKNLTISKISSFKNDDMIESIESLRSAVKIMSLGIDYRKYSKFILITSRAVVKLDNGGYQSVRLDRVTENPTNEDLDFCVNFVIESSIILKEFDFMVKLK
jgi:hypothetical protein